MPCRAQLQEHYEFADFAAKAALAVLLKHLPLSLPELWLFCHSPTDPQEPHMVSALLTFVTAFCYRWGKRWLSMVWVEIDSWCPGRLVNLTPSQTLRSPTYRRLRSPF